MDLVVVSAFLVLGTFAIFGSLLRVRAQMAKAKRKQTARARELYAEAYAPLRSSASLEVLQRQAPLLAAADALEKRAEGIQTWPFDDALLARAVVIASSVLAAVITRLAQRFLPGVVADIVRIEAHSCTGFACEAAAPPLTLFVTDATSSSIVVRGVAIENLEVPSPVPPLRPARAACSEGIASADGVLRASSCAMDGGAAGTYSLDVTAPGFETAHVVVDVPAAPHVPGLCCQLGYQVRSLEVQLAPP